MRHPLMVLAAAGVALLPAFVWSAATAATGVGDTARWNVPPPVARDPLAIHTQFMVIITVLFVVAFAIMLYSMIRHRKSSGHAPTTFRGPRGLVQWIWLLVPFAILLFIDFVLMGIPAFHAVITDEDNALGTPRGKFIQPAAAVAADAQYHHSWHPQPQGK